MRGHSRAGDLCGGSRSFSCGCRFYAGQFIGCFLAVAKINGIDQFHIGRARRFHFHNALVQRDGGQALTFIGSRSYDGFRSALDRGDRDRAVLIHTGDQLDRAGERFAFILRLDRRRFGSRFGTVLIELYKIDLHIALFIDRGVGVRIDRDGCSVGKRKDVSFDLLVCFVRHFLSGRHIDVSVVIQFERQLLLLPSFSRLRLGHFGNHEFIEQVADLVGFRELLVRLMRQRTAVVIELDVMEHLIRQSDILLAETVVERIDRSRNVVDLDRFRLEADFVR